MNSDIQPFTIKDIPYSAALQQDGWADIRLFFMNYCLEPFSMPIKVVIGDKIAGVGALILHEKSAWLGHIIVDDSYRRQGIGYRIVEHLLDLAKKKGAESVSLIATDLGAPIYSRAGFKNAGEYQYLKRVSAWQQKSLSDKLIPATLAHIEQILELDQMINAENRTRLIQNHLHRAMLFIEGLEVEGYYLPQFGEGPIYARTARAGIALMELKYSSIDTAVIPLDNTLGIDFLETNGFQKQDITASKMVYGKDILWSPKQIFSRIGGNYG